MGGAVKSVSKLANKAVGGANKAVAGILGQNKSKGRSAVPAVPAAGAAGMSAPAGPTGPAFQVMDQGASNPFKAANRAAAGRPIFNQSQARMEQMGQQPVPGQPLAPGQPPQLNQGRFGNLMNQIKAPQAPVPGTIPAPIAPAPGQPPAPMAPQAPVPGSPPAINPIAAPAAPEVKPPAPAQAAPVQQQQAPGTPAPGAAPEATTGTAAPVSPEEQFKKTQSSMYQVNK